MYCQGSDYRFFPAGIIVMGKRCDLLLPELYQRIIPGPEFIASHNPAAFITIGVIDHQTIAPEIPADSRAGGIDCTGKSFPGLVFPHERAAFYRFTLI